MKRMTSEMNVARVAAMIGDPSRAAMLGALLGGEALPAGELAKRAGIAPSTASAHLARLVEHGLIIRHTAGRERRYALANADVAEALEALARIPWPSRGPKPAGPTDALRFARTCYDHLAGRLGVIVTGAMLEQRLISSRGYGVTARGEEWLEALDVDVEALRSSRRTFSRPCLDWTERREHLAGAVGAAVATVMLERHWIARLDGTRAVRLTLRGREGLYRVLQIPADLLSL